MKIATLVLMLILFVTTACGPAPESKPASQPPTANKLPTGAQAQGYLQTLIGIFNGGGGNGGTLESIIDYFTGLFGGGGNTNTTPTPTPKPTPTPTATPVPTPTPTPTPGATPTPTPSPTPTPVGVTAAQLAGKWLSNCIPQNADGLSRIDLATFTAVGQMTAASDIYQGTACGGAVMVKANVVSTYQIIGPSKAPGATEMRVLVSQITVTPQSALAAFSMNLDKMCGYSDWATGATKSIALNNTCITMFIPGTDFRTGVSISGTQLYFTNATNTAIDTSIMYLKQP